MNVRLRKAHARQETHRPDALIEGIVCAPILPGSVSSPGAPRQSIVATRKDAPTIRPSSWGQVQLAPGASVTENTKETSLACSQRDMNAQSSVGLRQSLLKTWVKMHNARFGYETEGDGSPRPFPLTVFSLHAVGAMLKQGGYGNASNFYSRAKEHIALGHPWSEQLQLTVRKANASVTTACQSAPLDLTAVWASDVSWCLELPGLQLFIVSGSSFCAREIEASRARRKHVTIDLERNQVSWNLPFAKTDTTGLGKVRTWGCVCAPFGNKPCAFHTQRTLRALGQQVRGPAAWNRVAAVSNGHRGHGGETEGRSVD